MGGITPAELAAIGGRLEGFAADAYARALVGRIGADVHVVEAEWGTVFDPAQIEVALKRISPKLVVVCQGDTSTTTTATDQSLAATTHGFW